jgi:hypothetical protein
VHKMSYRIVIASWRIVMHTLCSWNILLDCRISVHIMRTRDVLVFYWIFDMRSLSYRIVIVSWRIVMHTVCCWNILCYGRISVHIMRGRDVC